MTTNPKMLMDRYRIDPRKSLGQNFLHDPNTLRKIVDTANVQAGDVILEIGPGTGALTRMLAETHPEAEVVAVEVDRRLQPVLERELAELENVRVIYGDILDTNINTVLNGRPYMVVANVPYYISSAILKHILQHTMPRPTRIVMTTQYELAERICAVPGDMTVLAVSVQFYGQPHLVTRLSNGVFWPRPDVDSAVLRIDIYPEPLVSVPSEKLFFQVVKAGFSQKRKQLKNAVSGGLQVKSKIARALLEEAAIDPTRRAETLALDEWGRLTTVYADHTGVLVEALEGDIP
jgi:16S rRNA (adenine1518-N6/adenine1519-N6)-dimethyltransferase